jgi:hypothetical protein
MSRPKELTPKAVLVDLFGGADFDHEILDPEAAADLVLERLADAGFAIVPAPSPGIPSL